MAFRGDNQDYRWPRFAGRSQPQEDQLERRDPAVSLSLNDTLLELAVTLAGFVAVILLITAALYLGR